MSLFFKISSWFLNGTFYYINELISHPIFHFCTLLLGTCKLKTYKFCIRGVCFTPKAPRRIVKKRNMWWQIWKGGVFCPTRSNYIREVTKRIRLITIKTSPNGQGKIWYWIAFPITVQTPPPPLFSHTGIKYLYMTLKFYLSRSCSHLFI